MDGANSFFETDAGQFIAGAHRYLSAARILRYSEEAVTRGEMLKTPVLHLLAHGIELLLKYPLLRAGRDQVSVSKQYGHDLSALWKCEENAAIRKVVLQAAQEAWAEAEFSGAWPGEDFSLDPRSVLPEQVDVLAHLHGRSSGFALRYTLEKEEDAPRPAFLIDAFGDVAERTAMSPSYIERAS